MFVNDMLDAASAALGVTLTGCDDLGGSERSAVVRCRMPGEGTVVVKTYPDSAEGRESFAAEAAGLVLTAAGGVGPRLLASSRPDRLIVMTDLGSGPSLADVLLGSSRDAARSALTGWARACGKLATAMAGRESELTALVAAHHGPPRNGQAGPWLERRIKEIPQILAELSLPAPRGLDADLAEVAAIVHSPQYQVFSPGDICPDNNLLTQQGVMFVDYENAEFHSAFLDAAYLRMPFSTCWCVFRLPADLQRSAEAVYRDQVSEIHPDLASDAVWQAGLRSAVAAWTLHAMTYLLDRAMLTDRPTIDDGRAAPTKRQLLRYRWRQLIDELAPVPGASAGSGEFPALIALASQLLASTEHWQVPELPLYPAFR